MKVALKLFFYSDTYKKIHFTLQISTHRSMYVCTCVCVQQQKFYETILALTTCSAF